MRFPVPDAVSQTPIVGTGPQPNAPAIPVNTHETAANSPLAALKPGLREVAALAICFITTEDSNIGAATDTFAARRACLIQTWLTRPALGFGSTLRRRAAG